MFMVSVFHKMCVSQDGTAIVLQGRAVTQALLFVIFPLLFVIFPTNFQFADHHNTNATTYPFHYSSASRCFVFLFSCLVLKSCTIEQQTLYCIFTHLWRPPVLLLFVFVFVFVKIFYTSVETSCLGLSPLVSSDWKDFARAARRSK